MSENETVIYDPSWPTVNVTDFEAAFDVGEWQHAFDAGEITAAEFTQVWGVNPAEGYVIAYNTKE